MTITEADISFIKDTIDSYDIVILQLEIPMGINETIASWAKERGVPVMLNSAPSAPLSKKFLSDISWIAPNEHEAKDLTGITIQTSPSLNMDDVNKAIESLRQKGVENVIVTLGSSGAALWDGSTLFYSPCVDVVPVKDPTAAGDSFIGAFCTALCAGLTPKHALDFANYTATITVSRMGAQPSLPNLHEVKALMLSEGYTGFDLSLLEALEEVPND